jgi:hypothetical protein
MQKITFHSRHGIKFADKKIQVKGQNPASTQKSEKNLTHIEIDGEAFLVLTQSDVKPNEQGEKGVAGYGIWVFLGSEPRRHNLVGKMRNIGGQEPTLDVRSIFEDEVFLILDLVRAMIATPLTNQTPPESPQTPDQEA